MRKWILALGICLLLSGCTENQTVNNTDASGQEEEESMGYQQITQKEAKQIMDTESDYILLDVRTRQEYAGGHIPGAICLPNETIFEEPRELPDKNQIILVYCRSGNRSKQASKKLADLGYSDVREFGGIHTWPYEITTDDE